MYMCALRVFFQGRWDEGMGDDSFGEVQTRGAGQHADETNAQVDHNRDNRGALVTVNVHDDAYRCCLGNGKARFTLYRPRTICDHWTDKLFQNVTNVFSYVPTFKKVT